MGEQFAFAAWTLLQVSGWRVVPYGGIYVCGWECAICRQYWRNLQLRSLI